MIAIRLPWRPRARPSATLHEIPVCSKRANLGIHTTGRPGGLSRLISPPRRRERRETGHFSFGVASVAAKEDERAACNGATEAFAIYFSRLLRVGGSLPWWRLRDLCVFCFFGAAWFWWCSDFEPCCLLGRRFGTPALNGATEALRQSCSSAPSLCAPPF